MKAECKNQPAIGLVITSLGLVIFKCGLDLSLPAGEKLATGKALDPATAGSSPGEVLGAV
jgi:hypothetical protein